MAHQSQLPRIILDESNGALVFQHKIENPDDKTMRLRLSCRGTCPKPEKRCTCPETVIAIRAYRPDIPSNGLLVAYPTLDPNTFKMGNIWIPVAFLGRRGDDMVIDRCVQTWRANPRLVTVAQTGGRNLEDSVNELLLMVDKHVYYYSNVEEGRQRGKRLACLALHVATGAVTLHRPVRPSNLPVQDHQNHPVQDHQNHPVQEQDQHYIRRLDGEVRTLKTQKAAMQVQVNNVLRQQAAQQAGSLPPADDSPASASSLPPPAVVALNALV